MADADVADDRHVAERQVDVGETDAADLDRLILDVAGVLDVGEIDLDGKVNEVPHRAVGAKPGPPEETAVVETLSVAGAEEQVVVLAEPAVVELGPAAEVHAKCLVVGLGDEAVVPRRFQAELVRLGWCGGCGRCGNDIRRRIGGWGRLHGDGVLLLEGGDAILQTFEEFGVLAERGVCAAGGDQGDRRQPGNSDPIARPSHGAP